MIFPDYLNGTINCVDFKTGDISMAPIQGITMPAFAIQLKGNSNLFVVSNGLPLKIVEWNSVDPVATVVRDAFTPETDPKKSGNLWNIAKGTPQCGLIGGTYRSTICGKTPNAFGAGYIYSNKCGLRPFIEDIKSSSGLELTKDNKLYHVESCKDVVREFDYDPKTQKICMCLQVFSTSIRSVRILANLCNLFQLVAASYFNTKEILEIQVLIACSH